MMEKIIKKEKLKNLNKKISNNGLCESSIMNAIANAIDAKNIDNIKILSNSININDKNDIIFELYNNELLTSKRLNFIVNNCTKYFNVSSNLIKKLMKEKETILLDIIFNHLKFFDNEIILQFLFYYKNKKAISISALNQQISNEKYKISTSISFSALEQRILEEEISNRIYFFVKKKIKILHTSYYRDIHKYINIECSKKDIRMNMIKYLIEHGTDINKSICVSVKFDFPKKFYYLPGQYFYFTPLNSACKNGNEALVKLLVEHGADVNIENGKDKTPLCDACSSGNEAIAKYLVEHGAYVNEVDDIYETPLFKACSSGNEDLVKYLVEIGANINHLNSHHETPLFRACESGNKAIVKYLIEQGTYVNLTNEYDETPLVIACSSGKENIVKYLIELGMDIFRIKRYGHSLLFNACSSGNVDLVKFLIELGLDINKTVFGESVLFKACESGSVDLVKYLVECGLDVNQTNIHNETPLFNACENGNEAIVKYLVEQGANVNNRRDYDNATPLSIACKNQYKEIKKYLVKHGAKRFSIYFKDSKLRIFIAN